MTYYAHINTTDNSIGKGDCPVSGDNIVCLEITEEVYNNIDRYIYNGTDLVLNPNYEHDKEQKEQERINKLTMTALDFIGVLEHFGLDYVTQIKPFLEANPELEKQLKYCQNVWCGVAKQIFKEPLTLGNVTITADMVEIAFRLKNGEVNNDD